MASKSGSNNSAEVANDPAMKDATLTEEASSIVLDDLHCCHHWERQLISFCGILHVCCFTL